MGDPKLDLEKLKAVRDWTEDLVDELSRSDVLPCKNTNRVGDCISRQRHKLVEEMHPSKLCSRCKTRWYAMMASKGINFVYTTKTEHKLEGVDWGARE